MVGKSNWKKIERIVMGYGGGDGSSKNEKKIEKEISG